MPARCTAPSVHADEQTAGRGRLSRRWFSPPGNLYLSIVLRLDLPPARRSELGFLAALAVADAVDALLPRQVRATLKWPNDVLVRDGKIAGILVEQAGEAMILGIGLNVLHAPSGVSYQVSTIVGCGGLATVDGTREKLLAGVGELDRCLAAGRVRTDPRRVAGAGASSRQHAGRAAGRSFRHRPVRGDRYRRRAAAGHAAGPRTHRRGRRRAGGGGAGWRIRGGARLPRRLARPVLRPCRESVSHTYERAGCSAGTESRRVDGGAFEGIAPATQTPDQTWLGHGADARCKGHQARHAGGD